MRVMTLTNKFIQNLANRPLAKSKFNMQFSLSTYSTIYFYYICQTKFTKD